MSFKKYTSKEKIKTVNTFYNVLFLINYDFLSIINLTKL